MFLGNYFVVSTSYRLLTITMLLATHQHSSYRIKFGVELWTVSYNESNIPDEELVRNDVVAAIQLRRLHSPVVSD